ncbi:MAG: ABC transporter permease [Actinomycetota bacterium]
MPDARGEFERQRALEQQASAEGGFHGQALHREIADIGEVGVPESGVPGHVDEVPVETGEIATMSQGKLAWRRFRRHKLAMGSAIVLILIILAAVFAPLISPYAFTDQDLTAARQGPSWSHPFGTDTLGRDQFTRVLYGGRISLFVGFAVALFATGIGIAVGAVAGYYGGRTDNFLMRLTDLFLSIPLIIVLILGSAIVGGSVLGIVGVLALFLWMVDARIIRGVFLSMKEKEFVEAAHASGATNRRIIVREMLPNAMGPIVVATTLSVAVAILTESVLSYLGYGIQGQTPTWGNLLDDAQNSMVTSPWLIIFPGLAILITVICVNFLGDGLRDAFDPQGAASVGSKRRKRKKRRDA